MSNSRLEAFSDGVIAIIITIMVLELKVPHGETMDALEPLIPNFLSYVLSFTYVGIYWTNHHGLDGRESPGSGALGALWTGAADGRHRVLDTAASDDGRAGPGLASQ